MASKETFPGMPTIAERSLGRNLAMGTNVNSFTPAEHVHPVRHFNSLPEITLGFVVASQWEWSMNWPLEEEPN